MKTAIYAKNLDKDVRLALYGIIEYSRVKLFPRHKNISVKLHLREHIVDGERLYRVMNQFINIKYEYQGNEKEYNPSWAQSG